MLGDELHLIEDGRVIHRSTEVARRRAIEVEIHGELELERLRFSPLPFVHSEDARKREGDFREIDPIEGVAGHLQTFLILHRAHFHYRRPAMNSVISNTLTRSGRLRFNGEAALSICILHP